jgi:2-polyprenyl-6-methoxyphenol hydroxylase-like FAD-dependent oxidoreductase
MGVIEIAGAGPAGTAAALAAISEGAAVRIHEKSIFPRHKVCGEFLSPEARAALESLGVWGEIAAAGPAIIRDVRLHFGRATKCWRLPAPAYGLSRARLDSALLDAARSRGAAFVRDSFHPAGGTAVIAHGRRDAASRGSRLFGFKAHFAGPAADSVELFFRSGGYAGVSAIENGAANVCGLAPESALSGCRFDIDRFVAGWPQLRERLTPFSRTMDWLVTGPLVFRRVTESPGERLYPAGDALGFVDPFTGSGILAALLTGKLAGSAAARGVPPPAYLRQCTNLLGPQYRFAALARLALFNGWAESLAGWLPGSLLFSLTRPNIALK